MTQNPNASAPVAKTDHPQASPHLQRGLSNRHIQLIAIGGAIGTGLFLGSAKTLQLTGPSIVLTYAIIGVVIFAVMRTMGEILLSKTGYKTFTDYISDILGPRAGFFVAWSYWFFWVTTGIADVIAITSYVGFWFPELDPRIPALIVIVALLALNLPSVKNFGEIEFWFAIIKLVAISLLILVGFWMVLIGFSANGHTASVANIWEHGGLFPNGAMGFLGSFQIALFAFVGAELVGAAVAETHEPEKTLPKAINAVPARIVIFYALPLLAIVMVTPWNQLDPNVSPFVSTFTMAGIGIAAGLVNFVVLTSAASSANSGIFSTSRMIYGLADEGNAPSFLKKLSKNGVPQNALYLTCVLLLFSLVMLTVGDSMINAFTLVSAVATLMGIFTWVMMLIAYIVYRRNFPERHAASTYKVPGGTVTAWICLAFFVVMIFAFLTQEDTRLALMLSPIWFVGVWAVYEVMRKRHARKAVAAAASKAVEN